MRVLSFCAREEGAAGMCSHAHSARAPALMHRVLLQFMFYYATSFNGDISGWDTSSVQNMEVRAIALAVIYIIPRRTPRIPNIFDSLRLLSPHIPPSEACGC